jgi:primosomal protein N' (replication factor Y)
VAAGTKAVKEPALVNPVASVMVDLPLPHLDRAFDYLVPAVLDAQVRLGSRVRVRFSGRLVDGFVLERHERVADDRKLAFLERAVGEPVLTAETIALFRAVADRWAGNFIDVVRLGVPPRHAGAEAVGVDGANFSGRSGLIPPKSAPSTATGWARYRSGPAFLSAIAGGLPARAVWSAMPAEDWPTRIAEAVHVALEAGRGAVVVVPDAKDLRRLDEVMTAVLGVGRHVALSAELGPSERYRRWLAARRGTVRAVIGTRAATYVPVADLGLVAIWDDGDDLHDEPRAPYANARDVLVLRSAQTGAALLVGGFARTAEAQSLVDAGWAHDLVATRDVVRRAGPRISATGEDVELARDPAAAAARLPSLAWRTARRALEQGAPVLVQVPRRGYVPTLACIQDRTPARCSVCAGPLAASSARATPSCRWCGRPAADWACPVCAGRRMRAVVVGAGRTAEELGRAFPGFAVHTSGADRVLSRVDGRAAIVVATPGAEPVAAGGYGAALLLDGWALLSRADLRATEETLRRWFNAAALVRTGGSIIIGADASIPAVQALIRWDPVGAAMRELAERTELAFPPASRMASITGTAAAVADLLALAQLPEQTEVIGPVPLAGTARRTNPGDEEHERVLLRAARSDGAALAHALKAAAAARSARKAADAVRIVLDPRELI